MNLEIKGNKDLSEESVRFLYRLILEYMRKGEFFEDPKDHQEFIEKQQSRPK